MMMMMIFQPVLSAWVQVSVRAECQARQATGDTDDARQSSTVVHQQLQGGCCAASVPAQSSTQMHRSQWQRLAR